MRRVWIKQDQIYHVPFYKQKMKMILLLLLVMAVVFLSYQVFCLSQLNRTMLFFEDRQDSHSRNVHSRFQSIAFARNNKTVSSSSIPGHNDHHFNHSLRGVPAKFQSHYSPQLHSYFKCISTGVEISIDKVNDDYCDCEEDGSDEPSTNACKLGRFYCSQTDHPIPSSRINDGICDCCDQSDEWLRSSQLPPLKCPSDCR